MQLAACCGVRFIRYLIDLAQDIWHWRRDMRLLKLATLLLQLQIMATTMSPETLKQLLAKLTGNDDASTSATKLGATKAPHLKVVEPVDNGISAE